MAVGPKNVSDIRLGDSQALQESMAEHGLAGSRLARENGDAFENENSSLKCGEGSFVAGGGIIVVAIRSGSERPAFQAEMRFIHCHPHPPATSPFSAGEPTLLIRIGIPNCRT